MGLENFPIAGFTVVLKSRAAFDRVAGSNGSIDTMAKVMFASPPVKLVPPDFGFGEINQNSGPHTKSLGLAIVEVFFMLVVEAKVSGSFDEEGLWGRSLFGWEEIRHLFSCEGRFFSQKKTNYFLNRRNKTKPVHVISAEVINLHCDYDECTKRFFCIA